MARRFKPPELRGTFGTLVRTTLQQAGVVKDALLERATARSGSRRDEALAELGDAVLSLIRAGEIDLAELPEVRAVVAELDEMDDEADAPRSRHVRRRPPPGGVKRDMPRDLEDDDAELRDALDSARFETPRFETSRSRFDSRGDGTVGSGAIAPASPRRPASETKVWRPPAQAPAPQAASGSAGGISFDDEDLSDYMHPDDVPARDGSKEGGKEPPKPD